MNTRLLAYLRSLGLSRDASDDQAWEFYQNLRGMERSVANALNYNETDQQARTNCDLALRSLGVDPQNPHELLPSEEPGDSATDESALRQQILAEEAQRRTQIREAAEMASAPQDLVNRLLDDATVSVDSARQQILADYRSRNRSEVATEAPAQHSRQSVTGHDRNSLAAALMLRNGINDPARQWYQYNPENGLSRYRDMGSDAEIGRAVDRGHELSEMPMVEICRRALALSGIQCEARVRSVVNAFRAASSTADVSNIFTQTFGALMLQGFEEAVDTTMGWTTERDNPNFFSIPRVRMGKVGGLQKLGAGGTAEDVTFDDKAENTKVNRYAGMFVIDEQDLINDTFGALQSMTPQEMGAAARRLRPDLVYAVLLNNPNMRDGTALFHADHNNLQTTTPLAFAGLQTLLTTIAIQQENGVNLNLRGQYIIVPQTLRFTARDLIGSPTVVVAGSTDLTRGSGNSLASEDLTVVSDSRLDNGVTDPDSGTSLTGSTEDWYVAAAGSRHTIEVTYLRGSSRSPEIRSSILDTGRFGIAFDVHQDIGATPLAWEGIAKADAS